MYKVTKYPHGTFSWAENSSTDPQKAIAFYMDLFGWGKYEIPIDENNTYTMFQHQGENVAALSGMLPEGVPSLWFNYVTVDDVDALPQAVTDNGGTITHGPWDVFDSGRLLHIADPEGAHLGLWQPKQHIGAGIVNTVGAMCWNELLTRDAESAKTFYSKLLGWEYFGDEHYIHISNRGRNNGGMMKIWRCAAYVDGLLPRRRYRSRHDTGHRTGRKGSHAEDGSPRHRLVHRHRRPDRRCLLHHATGQSRPLGRIDCA